MTTLQVKYKKFIMAALKCDKVILKEAKFSS